MKTENFPNQRKENRHPGPGNTERPKEDQPKEHHTKTHRNQKDKNYLCSPVILVNNFLFCDTFDFGIRVMMAS